MTPLVELQARTPAGAGLVRTAFMQPLGSVRAYDFLGQVCLGLQPSLR